jgi:hypothetical protein
MRPVSRRRWDMDERGRGIGSGEVFARNVSELAEAMRDPGWVAEEPELHLFPHLQAACEELGFEIRSARSDGEIFVLDLEPSEPGLSVGAVRQAAITLIASIAEESTQVRQRNRDDVIEFEVATGTVGSETFAPHGHLVRLRIRRTSS